METKMAIGYQVRYEQACVGRKIYKHVETAGVSTAIEFG